MRHQRVQLDLRISHPSRDLSATCRLLGLKPHILWRAGEGRRTPRGHAIGGLRANSYCSIPFGKTRRQSFAGRMRAALAQLAPHRRLLRRLTSTGGNIRFAVGWFCDEDTGENLDSTLIRELAELQIGVELFLYVPDPPAKRVRKAR